MFLTTIAHTCERSLVFSAPARSAGLWPRCSHSSTSFQPIRLIDESAGVARGKALDIAQSAGLAGFSTLVTGGERTFGVRRRIAVRARRLPARRAASGTARKRLRCCGGCRCAAGRFCAPAPISWDV